MGGEAGRTVQLARPALGCFSAVGAVRRRVLPTCCPRVYNTAPEPPWAGGCPPSTQHLKSSRGRKPLCSTAHKPRGDQSQLSEADCDPRGGRWSELKLETEKKERESWSQRVRCPRMAGGRTAGGGREAGPPTAAEQVGSRGHGGTGQQSQEAAAQSTQD